MRKRTITSILAGFLLGMWVVPHGALASVTKGGTFFAKVDADPTTLNPITSSDGYASAVQSYVLDTLLTRDPDTFKWLPELAESWKISKDGKHFTFKLRQGVKWDDGQPLTAEDVKYSFDVYFEGRFLAPHKRLYYENFKEVKVIDPRTVEFVVKEIYFKNFDVAAELVVFPKHFYGVGDPNDPKFNRELVGTGPYVLKSWEKGQKIELERNKNFWGGSLPFFKDRYNFDRVVLKPIDTVEVAIEMLKKGDLDYVDLSAFPDQFMTKLQGPEFGPDKKVRAVKVHNSSADGFGYGFIAWNLKNPLFQDRDVRMAMSHLIDRDLMIQKFRYGMAMKATGPWGNESPSSSPKVKAVEYDPKKAVELLKKAGWNLTDKGMVKVIDGKETPFEFTLVTGTQTFERYATVIKEDMRKVGITMNIKVLEWNSFVKLLDERKFDAINLAWSVGSLEQDPKQIWHSASIAGTGSNFVSYRNPKVDELIDKLRASLDEKVRRKYFRELHEIIAADQPYSFLFNKKYELSGEQTRIKKIKDTFKYTVGSDTWWISPE